MRTKTRLEKTVEGIKTAFLRYNLENRILLEQDILTINSGGNLNSWKPILLATAIILLPLSILIYYFLVDNTNSVILWVMFLIIWFAYDFYKILRIPNVLKLNLKNNYLDIENSNRGLKKLFPPRQIA